MKKVYKLKNLDCANCAAKMESAAKKIKGVESIDISFMSQRMKLIAPDNIFEQVLQEIKKVFHKIEPDCEIEER